jgi:hypothetical protein
VGLFFLGLGLVNLKIERSHQEVQPSE